MATQHLNQRRIIINQIQLLRKNLRPSLTLGSL